MSIVPFRRSRLGALLLAALLALSLLPINALADETIGEISVSTEAELNNAAAANVYNTIHLANSIELAAPFIVSGELTLDLCGFCLSAAFDPDQVADPLATVIVEKKAKLTVTGIDGSELAPPVLPEGKTNECYGIYVNKKGELILSGNVQVKTDDDTSYMVFLLSNAKMTIAEGSGIKGGEFGIKVPSGSDIESLTISTAGEVTSGSAISKVNIPFMKIVSSDIRILADGENVERGMNAPDPSVCSYEFIPTGSIPPAPSVAPVPTADPTATPSPTPTATPTESPSASPSASPSESPSASPSESPSASPSESPSASPSESPSASPSESPSASPSSSPSASPSADPELPATSAMSWDGTRAMWRAVTGADTYRVQLYMNGTDEGCRRGEAVTVSDTLYDFSEQMKGDGSYYFTVQAFAGSTGGKISSFSRAALVDHTAPRITSKAPVRHDAKRATFYFTSSEAGDYYFILSSENSATPLPESVVTSADAIHGACTAAEQAISLNRIADAGAKAIFLVVEDRAGNRSNSYKIVIPAYNEASPTPSPTPTPTPNPATYTVTANNGTGYSIVAVGSSTNKVQAGGSYSFTVSILNGYTYNSSFSVKANDKALTASSGVYTIKNIQADQKITVSGVVAASTPVPTAIPSSPSITTTLLPSATMGKSYSQQLTATGGTPITWSYTGSLPRGMSLSYGGLLSGTPAEEGTFRITVKAANSTGSRTRDMTLVVTSADYTVTQGANANWTKGTQEGLTFQGSGESDFTVRVDGSVVPADKVVFSADKRSVTLDAAYLESLSAGSHTLTLLYSDGSAKARFNVKAAERTVAPTISAQPQNTAAAPGSDATFTVTSGGTTPLQCSWQVDKNDGAGWTDIPGANSASYTLKGVSQTQSGWKFRCVVTNAAGSAESNPAVLTVEDEAEPSPQPEAPKKASSAGRILLFSLLGVGLVGLGTGAYLFFRRRDEFYDDFSDDDE